MRTLFVVGSLLLTLLLLGLSYLQPLFAWSFLLVGPVMVRGFQDMLQTRQAVRRNFPILGNFRYLFELVRPEINQYFVESNTDGAPFNRDTRSRCSRSTAGRRRAASRTTPGRAASARTTWSPAAI